MWSWLQRLFRRRPAPPGDRGGMGERLAAEWLRRERGFHGILCNWRSPRDERLEIDIVGSDRGVLVFVEVKTRPAHALVPGYYAAVNKRKKSAILRAARDYLARLREKPRTVRYDVVEVVTDGGSADPEIRHFENVPLFPKEFLRGR